jgi:flagellum-specific peptidoglycan hydrolase FlgJ
MSRLTDDPKENIEIVKKAALKVFKDNIIVAQLCTAQAILESNIRHTPSKLALNYCNLFGIKPGINRKGTADPGIVNLMTKEYVHNKGFIDIAQPFLSNLNIEDSFKQYDKLLKLDRYRNVFECKTFKEAAELIQEDGYATDITYTEELLSVYDDCKLQNMVSI